MLSWALGLISMVLNTYGPGLAAFQSEGPQTDSHSVPFSRFSLLNSAARYKDPWARQGFTTCSRHGRGSTIISGKTASRRRSAKRTSEESVSDYIPAVLLTDASRQNGHRPPRTPRSSFRTSRLCLLQREGTDHQRSLAPGRRGSRSTGDGCVSDSSCDIMPV
jgi:hypothetical protein